ncbi:unnamed protein product [Bursaphelenchus xylophilus]|uniref:(pine wood nematode) hypothetical protein n=1 Tax=Bursaphelenchus xylophilus TaxID=6326 RepID=A0A1I7S865_BURXY|nr:unnamed protein product [Bursaphelenchus xylophilus]CAG9080520.1 unnamed protein product [Bursaphelenchus xylophilus]
MKVRLFVVCLVIIALTRNATAAPEPSPEPQLAKVAAKVAGQVLKWGAYILASLPWGRKKEKPPLNPSQLGYPGAG